MTQAKTKPCLVRGFAYVYDGKRNWRSSNDDHWGGSLAPAPVEQGVHVGARAVQGETCEIYRAKDGRFFGQVWRPEAPPERPQAAFDADVERLVQAYRAGGEVAALGAYNQIVKDGKLPMWEAVTLGARFRTVVNWRGRFLDVPRSA